MQYRSFLAIIISTLLFQNVKAQNFDKLGVLKGHLVKLYHSKGHEDRAKTIVNRVDKAFTYYRQLLDFEPSVTLLVLSEKDWSQYTDFPVYGMPHYKDDQVLVVAAEDNVFWKSFLPPLEQLPAELREKVSTTYVKADGTLSMEAFFDILALHELGHAFHFQAGLNMQRKWMGEFFPNVLLHTYIAENEPGSLPALTIFPMMVINAGTSGFQYTSLKDIEERYDEIGKLHPKNYGWYQSRWHFAAGKIYEEEGKEIGRKIWDVLQNKNEKLSDEELISYFNASGLECIVRLVREWDEAIEN